jgi:hypothetical protein
MSMVQSADAVSLGIPGLAESQGHGRRPFLSAFVETRPDAKRTRVDETNCAE